MGKRTPKLHLHQNTGKLQQLPTPSTTSSSAGDTVQNGNEEMAQKFELELCWCIQQLQNALKSGKLNNKQVDEQRKLLQTLMSNSTPIVKKRQIMRQTFGDYRLKMTEQERKYNNQSTAAKMKVLPVKKQEKSVFIKKALFTYGDNNFRFNFPEPEQLAHNVSSMQIEEQPNHSQTSNIPQENFSYRPSDNSFRFNF